MPAKILWIETGSSNNLFIPALRKKGFHVEIVPTGKAAIEHISSDKPQVVVVNAASLRSNGVRICQNIRASSNGLPILLIANPDYPLTEEGVINVTLSLPFTVRKLVNRINPLLPKDNPKLLKVGKISLDTDHNIVSCDGSDTSLTPRLTHLLKMFLASPGIVLERERLFKEVWNTDYTGDTRTLDVHISWLRRAIEEDPHKPKNF